MRRETGNQFINAPVMKVQAISKLSLTAGQLIPTLFRYGGREPPSGVAGERHDQAGVGELLGSDQSGMVLPDIDAVALQAGDNISGTSVSGSGPDVVARSGRFLSIAMRLKYSAAIKLLAEPCKQTNATFCEPMSSPAISFEWWPLIRSRFAIGYQFIKSPFGLPRFTISRQYA